MTTKLSYCRTKEIFKVAARSGEQAGNENTFCAKIDRSISGRSSSLEMLTVKNFCSCIHGHVPSNSFLKPTTKKWNT
jgi:hypothetical protein